MSRAGHGMPMPRTGVGSRAINGDSYVCRYRTSVRTGLVLSIPINKKITPSGVLCKSYCDYLLCQT